MAKKEQPTDPKTEQSTPRPTRTKKSAKVQAEDSNQEIPATDSETDNSQKEKVKTTTVRIKKTKLDQSEEAAPKKKRAVKAKPVLEQVAKEETTTDEVVQADALAAEATKEAPPVTETVQVEPDVAVVTKEAAPVEETVQVEPTPVEIKMENESGEEGEESDEDEDVGPVEPSDTDDIIDRYNKLSKEELVEVLEALVKEEDVNKVRPHIGYIRIAFRKLIKDESEANYEKRLQTSEDHDDTSEEPLDLLAEQFEQALQSYREKKNIYDQALEQQKQGNLVEKERILEELRKLIESEEELKRTYDQFRDLQEQWRNIGTVPQGSKSTLWNNYHFLVEKFFDKVKINKELKDLDLKKNLEAKTELCEKAEELLLETSITKSFQMLQKLHEAWKESGPVPKDKKDDIWERFKSATEKLNKRRQEYYEGLREEQNSNYSAKLLLSEKAEQLSAIIPESPKQWQNITDQINELFRLWKTIGFAPKKVNNEIWNRFRASLDTFYRNKKEYFNRYKEVQTENYNQKLNLCLQAEALKYSEDWRLTTEELIALQKEWKKIGPVPTKFSGKIWKRFRAACDEFFNKKSEHFAHIGEKQEENLKKKLDIIQRVKNHPYTDDNVDNLRVLKDFQREWMDIGHVPIKQKEKLQNEFRKAIDHQFDRLNISKTVKSTMNFRSRVENIRSAPNADNLIYKERNFIINKINTIESDIKIWENNIGFFASSKKADILKAEFEEKIEQGRQEITSLEEKLKILRE